MIGLGKWLCKLDTTLVDKKTTLTILDNDGQYELIAEIEGFNTPDFEISNITEIGKSLHLNVNTPLLPGKTIKVRISFDGDKLTGTARLPLIGVVDFMGEKIN